MQKYHNSIQFKDLLSDTPFKTRLTSQPSNLHSSSILDQSLTTNLSITQLQDSIVITGETPIYYGTIQYAPFLVVLLSA